MYRDLKLNISNVIITFHTFYSLLHWYRLKSRELETYKYVPQGVPRTYVL